MGKPLADNGWSISRTGERKYLANEEKGKIESCFDNIGYTRLLASAINGWLKIKVEELKPLPKGFYPCGGLQAIHPGQQGLNKILLTRSWYTTRFCHVLYRQGFCCQEKD